MDTQEARETSRSPAPLFGARRMLLVASGSASASFLPFWVNWTRQTYPNLELRVALTRSAERFVTAQTVALLSGAGVLRDEWTDEPSPQAAHVALTEWADAFAVYPASANFLTRLALGLGDTPVMLALQCTTAVVGLAPAVPPGMTRNPVYRQHLAALAGRANIAVAPTQHGRSATTGRSGDGVSIPLWVLIELMEKQRAHLGQIGAIGKSATEAMPESTTESK